MNSYRGQGTIAPLKVASIGQGTIEYLVILAVIVVVGLVVVGLSTGFLDSGSQVIANTQGISTATSTGIVVRESVLDYEGTALLSLQNNTGEEVTLTKINIDGTELNYNNKILPTNNLLFSLPQTNCSCQEGEKNKTCTYDVYYTTKYGLEKKETLQINLQCTENAQANIPSITPQVPADTQSPQIVSFSPENNFESENLLVTFNYQATDNNVVQSCSLYINNQIVDTNNNSTGTLTHTFQEDILTSWHISCTDTSNNTTNTEPRNININTTPYQITTCIELQEMNQDLTGDYNLQNDIDCSNTINWNSEAGFIPIGNSTTPFTGTLNGNKNIISSLYINLPESNGVGLVGVSSNNATIFDFGLTDLNITGNSLVGGVVGSVVNNTYISRTFTTGIIFGNGNGVGGIIGQKNASSSPVNSYSNVNITGNNAVGGIIGNNYGPSSNLLFYGSITANSNFGGIIGNNLYLSTTNSFWDVDITQIGISGSDNFGATGKTTSEMKQQSTFTDWDFTNTWEINSEINDGYPYLKWQTE